MLTQVLELAEYGFIEVGQWRLDQRLKSGIRFAVFSLQKERVLYAFEVNGTVLYIGVCDSSTTTFEARMRRYQGLQGGSTNKRIGKLIKGCLSQSLPVSIWALKPEATRLKELVVDLVKGLENPLIDKFNPRWNIQR